MFLMQQPSHQNAPHRQHTSPRTCPPPQLLGCRGFDEWGAFWASSMKRCHVGVERMAVKQGPTARSCILSCGGQRTMRTCMTGCPRLEPEELRLEDFEGAAWAFLSACGCWRARCCGTEARCCSTEPCGCGSRGSLCSSMLSWSGICAASRGPSTGSLHPFARSCLTALLPALCRCPLPTPQTACTCRACWSGQLSWRAVRAHLWPWSWPALRWCAPSARCGERGLGRLGCDGQHPSLQAQVLNCCFHASLSWLRPAPTPCLHLLSGCPLGSRTLLADHPLPAPMPAEHQVAAGGRCGGCGLLQRGRGDGAGGRQPRGGPGL